jgi:hypothetical protein
MAQSQVLEMSAQGYSQIEIATQLQVYRDCHKQRCGLSKTASARKPKYINEVVPEEYQKCMSRNEAQPERNPSNCRNSFRS